MKKTKKLLLIIIFISIALILVASTNVNAANIKTGDINQDGEVNQEDLNLVYDHVRGVTKLNEEQMKLADIVSDGKINTRDLSKLSVIIKANEFEKGDVNQDGKIDQEDLNLVRDYVVGIGQLNAVQKEIADIVSDGKINTRDLSKLSVIIKANEFEKGDVNQDGKVNKEDLNLICNYIGGLGQLNAVQKEIADIVSDGKINTRDLSKLSVIIKANEFEKGDVNQDGKIDQEDVNLLYDYVRGLGQLNAVQKEIADIISDGKINTRDLSKLSVIIKANEFEKGDVNQDRKIDQEDVNLLYDYVRGVTQLNAVQKEIADIISDGKINTRDLSKLSAIIKSK